MGVTEGSWRLKAILFCVFMPLMLYGIQGFFMASADSMTVTPITDANELEDLGGMNESSQDAVREKGVSVGTDVIGIVKGIFDFATFGSIDGTPEWARWFLTSFITGILITLMYIIYTFVYEGIKALPFT